MILALLMPAWAAIAVSYLAAFLLWRRIAAISADTANVSEKPCGVPDLPLAQRLAPAIRARVGAGVIGFLIAYVESQLKNITTEPIVMIEGTRHQDFLAQRARACTLPCPANIPGWLQSKRAAWHSMQILERDNAVFRRPYHIHFCSEPANQGERPMKRTQPPQKRYIGDWTVSADR